MQRNTYILSIGCLLMIMASCRKMIHVDPPSHLLTTSSVFENLKTTESALFAAYSNMADNEVCLYSGRFSVSFGVSADEFIPYNSTDVILDQFYRNQLLLNNSSVNLAFWTESYRIVYIANSILENVPYAAYTDSVKNMLTGQAHFLRAFCNFYLVNTFGDLPLVTTTNWKNSRLLARSPVADVYRLILEDLRMAEEQLLPNYTKDKGQRIFPSRYAAEALLARVQLYLKNWKEAERYATMIIEEPGTFSLVGLNDIMAPDNTEAIWQIKQFADGTNNSSPEGKRIIPRIKNSNIGPLVYFGPDFLNGFEEGDQRKKNWIDSTRMSTTGKVFYYPYKYKTSKGTISSTYSEYHTMLRLSELYLVRAEARLEMNLLEAAVKDLNVIRERAGLPGLKQNLAAGEIRNALIHERRFELFAEWGHRWLDLKRWGIASTILKPLKENWAETDLLCPLPVTEIQYNPNFTQNPGY